MSILRNRQSCVNSTSTDVLPFFVFSRIWLLRVDDVVLLLFLCQRALSLRQTVNKQLIMRARAMSVFAFWRVFYLEASISIRISKHCSNPSHEEKAKNLVYRAFEKRRKKARTKNKKKPPTNVKDTHYSYVL